MSDRVMTKGDHILLLKDKECLSWYEWWMDLMTINGCENENNILKVSRTVIQR